MRKYKVSRWLNRIETVEIEKETGRSVWVRGRKELKACNTHKYFDTFEEAKRYLIVRFETNIINAREVIRKTESSLETLRKMQE